MTDKDEKPKTDTPIRHHELTAERKARAWELRVQCKTQSFIAKELGICQQSVSALLKEALAEYKENNKREIEESINEQLAVIDEKIQELENAWMLSQAGGEYDVKYVAEIRALLADKRKIQGLDAATKVDNSGKVKVEFADELKQLLDGIVTSNSKTTG